MRNGHEKKPRGVWPRSLASEGPIFPCDEPAEVKAGLQKRFQGLQLSAQHEVALGP